MAYAQSAAAQWRVALAICPSSPSLSALEPRKRFEGRSFVCCISNFKFRISNPQIQIQIQISNFKFQIQISNFNFQIQIPRILHPRLETRSVRPSRRSQDAPRASQGCLAASAAAPRGRFGALASPRARSGLTSPLLALGACPPSLYIHTFASD